MNPRIRPIVLITTSFPITRDGSEAAGGFVADVARSLSLHVPVRVVAPGRHDGVEVWSDRLSIYRYQAPDQALSTLRLWHPLDCLRILEVLKAGSRATAQATRDGVAHILALWALPSGYWARSAARITGTPYSVWTLGSDIWSLGRIPIVRSLLSRVLIDARQRFSDGLQLQEDTRELCGMPVRFLPSTRNIGLRRTEAVRQTGPYRLVFIGRWHPNKGIDLLLDALHLLDAGSRASIESIDIYGGGPLEELVRHQVEQLSATLPIRAHGYLAKEQAEQALVDADFALLPSRIESIPVVYSDAVKLGCPIVGMPVGDLPSLLAEGTGVCAREVTASAFAQALSEALAIGPFRYQTGLHRMSLRFSNEHEVVPTLLSLAGPP